MTWGDWFDVIGAVAEYVSAYDACSAEFEVVGGQRGFLGWGILGVNWTPGEVRADE